MPTSLCGFSARNKYLIDHMAKYFVWYSFRFPGFLCLCPDQRCSRMCLWTIETSISLAGPLYSLIRASCPPPLGNSPSRGSHYGTQLEITQSLRPQPHLPRNPAPTFYLASRLDIVHGLNGCYTTVLRSMCPVCHLHSQIQPHPTVGIVLQLPQTQFAPSSATAPTNLPRPYSVLPSMLWASPKHLHEIVLFCLGDEPHLSCDAFGVHPSLYRAAQCRWPHCNSGVVFLFSSFGRQWPFRMEGVAPTSANVHLIDERPPPVSPVDPHPARVSQSPTGYSCSRQSPSRLCDLRLPHSPPKLKVIIRSICSSLSTVSAKTEPMATRLFA